MVLSAAICSCACLSPCKQTPPRPKRDWTQAAPAHARRRDRARRRQRIEPVDRDRAVARDVDLIFVFYGVLARLRPAAGDGRHRRGVRLGPFHPTSCRSTASPASARRGGLGGGPDCSACRRISRCRRDSACISCRSSTRARSASPATSRWEFSARAATDGRASGRVVWRLGHRRHAPPAACTPPHARER